jgi:hypothetical protein
MSPQDSQTLPFLSHAPLFISDDPIEPKHPHHRGMRIHLKHPAPATALHLAEYEGMLESPLLEFADNSAADRRVRMCQVRGMTPGVIPTEVTGYQSFAIPLSRGVLDHQRRVDCDDRIRGCMSGYEINDTSL